MNHWDRLVQRTGRDRGAIKVNVYTALIGGKPNEDWREFCDLLAEEPLHLKRLLEVQHEPERPARLALGAGGGTRTPTA